MEFSIKFDTTKPKWSIIHSEWSQVIVLKKNIVFISLKMDFVVARLTLKKNPFRNTISVSNNLDADQAGLLRYRMAGITESAMVAYTHKYAEV